MTEEHKRKIGLANKGKRKGKTYEQLYGKKKALELKQKHKQLMLSNHPMKGKKFSKRHVTRMIHSRKDTHSKYWKWMRSEEYREKRQRIAVENQTGMKYEDWLKTLSKRDLYYLEVRRITKRQPIHLLENCKKRGKSGKHGAYHLDHKISRIYGFKNNIPAEKIGHISNLQFIPWLENVKKGANCE